MPSTPTRRAALAALALLVAGPSMSSSQISTTGPLTVQTREAASATGDVERVAAVADDVVVARVEATTGHGTSEGFPTTTSRVQVLQRFKGSSGATLQVTQLGGTDTTSRQLVLVRDDQLLQPGQVYLLALVNTRGTLMVVPVGGDRLLPGAATSSTPWLDYPAVADLQEALAAQDADVLQLVAAPRR